MITPVAPFTEIRRFGTALAAAFVAALLAAGPLPAQQQAAPGSTPGSTAGLVPAESESESESDTDTEAEAEAEEALEQYRVELIVFEYGDSLAGTTEDWSAPPDPAGETETADGAGSDIDEADAETHQDGAVPAGRQAGRPATDAASPGASGDTAGATGIDGDRPDEPVFRFMPLPEEELELGEVYRRLGTTEGYEPLLHVAWQQPGYEPEAARPLDLSRLAELPDGLQGEVRLYRSRFLHLELNLELWSEPRRPRSAPETATPAPLFPDRGRTDAGEPLDALEPDIYRLSERRKLRSGELHYYDHPRYGVLAKVTPVEAEEEPAAAPGTGDGEPAAPAPAGASSAAD